MLLKQIEFCNKQYAEVYVYFHSRKRASTSRGIAVSASSAKAKSKSVSVTENIDSDGSKTESILTGSEHLKPSVSFTI